MLSRKLNQIAESPWGKLVWAAVAALALIQMAAFYRLCSDQVQRAHARETAALEQSNAVSDCLDYLARSTISSCARQGGGASEAGSLAARDMPVIKGNHALLGSTVPVSFVFH